MSYSIERLHAQNYDEFMDFINMVFSQDLMTVHFQEDLPLLFAPDEEHMQNQYVIREDDAFVPLWGRFITPFYLADKVFKPRPSRM